MEGASWVQITHLSFINSVSLKKLVLLFFILWPLGPGVRAKHTYSGILSTYMPKVNGHHLRVLKVDGLSVCNYISQNKTWFRF